MLQYAPRHFRKRDDLIDGAGSDRFQIGQIYGASRGMPNTTQLASS